MFPLRCVTTTSPTVKVPWENQRSTLSSFDRTSSVRQPRKRYLDLKRKVDPSERWPLPWTDDSLFFRTWVTRVPKYENKRIETTPPSHPPPHILRRQVILLRLYVRSLGGSPLGPGGDRWTPVPLLLSFVSTCLLWQNKGPTLCVTIRLPQESHFRYTGQVLQPCSVGSRRNFRRVWFPQ